MRTGRKSSGGKYKKSRKRRSYEQARHFRQVMLGKEKRKTLRMRGGSERAVLLFTDQANLHDPSTKKTQITKIKGVLETPSNRFLARRNIITKGAIIDTEKGRARVTNRPSQEGAVNAVLLKD